MGVDFFAISRVVAKPVPEEYRVQRKPAGAAEIRQMERDLLAASPDVRALLMTLTGASFNGYSLVLPDKLSRGKQQDEFEKLCEADPDFVTVNWHTNTVYYKTAESKECDCGRSYSGYGEFCQELEALNGRPLAYMPPSTDTAPENGLVSADRASLCLAGLQALRHHFVADDWDPAMEKPVDYDCARREGDRHEESFFFRRFYACVALAADSGILQVG
jgi:hypothetical protein